VVLLLIDLEPPAPFGTGYSGDGAGEVVVVIEPVEGDGSASGTPSLSAFFNAISASSILPAAEATIRVQSSGPVSSNSSAVAVGSASRNSSCNCTDLSRGSGSARHCRNSATAGPR